jgi:hypothetical protein
MLLTCQYLPPYPTSRFHQVVIRHSTLSLMKGVEGSLKRKPFSAMSLDIRFADPKYKETSLFIKTPFQHRKDPIFIFDLTTYC